MAVSFPWRSSGSLAGALEQSPHTVLCVAWASKSIWQLGFQVEWSTKGIFQEAGNWGYQSCYELGRNCMLGLSCAQSCPTLCDPMGCSRQVPLSMGFFQARILERLAISTSRGSSWPRNRNRVSCVSCIAGWFFIEKLHSATLLFCSKELLSLPRFQGVGVKKQAPSLVRE